MEIVMRTNLALTAASTIGALVLAATVTHVTLAQGINLDTAAIEQWTMPPFMCLGSWAAFTPAHGGAMLMGDTVVFEDEVNAAMSAAFDAGLEVTALHNHFFFDEPKVFFMHIGGH